MEQNAQYAATAPVQSSYAFPALEDRFAAAAATSIARNLEELKQSLNQYANWAPPERIPFAAGLPKEYPYRQEILNAMSGNEISTLKGLLENQPLWARSLHDIQRDSSYVTRMLGHVVSNGLRSRYDYFSTSAFGISDRDSTSFLTMTT